MPGSVALATVEATRGAVSTTMPPQQQRQHRIPPPAAAAIAAGAAQARHGNAVGPPITASAPDVRLDPEMCCCGRYRRPTLVRHLCRCVPGAVTALPIVTIGLVSAIGASVIVNLSLREGGQVARGLSWASINVLGMVAIWWLWHKAYPDVDWPAVRWWFCGGAAWVAIGRFVLVWAFGPDTLEASVSHSGTSAAFQALSVVYWLGMWTVFYVLPIWLYQYGGAGVAADGADALRDRAGSRAKLVTTPTGRRVPMPAPMQSIAEGDDDAAAAGQAGAVSGDSGTGTTNGMGANDGGDELLGGGTIVSPARQSAAASPAAASITGHPRGPPASSVATTTTTTATTATTATAGSSALHSPPRVRRPTTQVAQQRMVALMVGTKQASTSAASASVATPAAVTALTSATLRSSRGLRTGAAFSMVFGLVATILSLVADVDILWLSPGLIVIMALAIQWDSRRGFSPLLRDWGAVSYIAFFYNAIAIGLSTLTVQLVWSVRDTPTVLFASVYVVQGVIALYFQMWRRISRVACGGYTASLPANLYFNWVVKLYLELLFFQVQPLSEQFWGLVILSLVRDVVVDGFLQWDLVRMARTRSAAWPPRRSVQSVQEAWHRAEQSMLTRMLAACVAFCAMGSEYILLRLGWGVPALTTRAQGDLGPLFWAVLVLVTTHLPGVYVVRLIHKRKITTAVRHAQEDAALAKRRAAEARPSVSVGGTGWTAVGSAAAARRQHRDTVRALNPMYGAAHTGADGGGGDGHRRQHARGESAPAVTAYSSGAHAGGAVMAGGGAVPEVASSAPSAMSSLAAAATGRLSSASEAGELPSGDACADSAATAIAGGAVNSDACSEAPPRRSDHRNHQRQAQGQRQGQHGGAASQHATDIDAAEAGGTAATTTATTGHNRHDGRRLTVAMTSVFTSTDEHLRFAKSLNSLWQLHQYDAISVMPLAVWLVLDSVATFNATHGADAAAT